MSMKVQLLRGVAVLAAERAERLTHPWRYCSGCGDPLPYGRRKRLCESCDKWATFLLRGSESARRRWLFQ